MPFYQAALACALAAVAGGATINGVERLGERGARAQLRAVFSLALALASAMAAVYVVSL
jgi:hypothetical protein